MLMLIYKLVIYHYEYFGHTTNLKTVESASAVTNRTLYSVVSAQDTLNSWNVQLSLQSATRIIEVTSEYNQSLDNLMYAQTIACNCPNIHEVI